MKETHARTNTRVFHIYKIDASKSHFTFNFMKYTVEGTNVQLILCQRLRNITDKAVAGGCGSRMVHYHNIFYHIILLLKILATNCVIDIRGACDACDVINVACKGVRSIYDDGFRCQHGSQPHSVHGLKYIAVRCLSYSNCHMRLQII